MFPKALCWLFKLKFPEVPPKKLPPVPAVDPRPPPKVEPIKYRYKFENVKKTLQNMKFCKN